MSTVQTREVSLSCQSPLLTLDQRTDLESLKSVAVVQSWWSCAVYVNKCAWFRAQAVLLKSPDGCLSHGFHGGPFSTHFLNSGVDNGTYLLPWGLIEAGTRGHCEWISQRAGRLKSFIIFNFYFLQHFYCFTITVVPVPPPPINLPCPGEDKYMYYIPVQELQKWLGGGGWKC